MRKVIFLDTETGGTDPYHHSLLSIGCVSCIWDERCLVEIDSFYREIKDSQYVTTNQALKINKLYPDFIEKSTYADIKSNVKKDFEDWVLIHTVDSKNKPIPAGHNILQFDQLFIQSSFSITRSHWQKLFHYIPIDTMVIANFLISSGVLSNTSCGLTGLARLFNIDAGKRAHRHNALDDARIAMKVYNKMLRVISNATLE